MVKHYNPTLSDMAQRIFNTKNGEHVSSEVSPILQPTVELKQYSNIVQSTEATNSTGTVIYNTPADKDFFLTAVQLSVIKDATSTSTFSGIVGSVDGLGTRRLISIQGITLTPQSETVSVVFDRPVKMTRNTSISVANNTATANINAFGAIYGYTEEVVK